MTQITAAAEYSFNIEAIGGNHIVTYQKVKCSLSKAIFASLLVSLLFGSCGTKEHYVEPDVVLKNTAAPAVSGGWRKMGDFFNTNCNVNYLFTIGDKAYFTVRGSKKTTATFWQYDPGANEFTVKASLPGSGIDSLPFFDIPVSMAINGKGYIALKWKDVYSYSALKKKNFWEYDPASNHWTQKADFFSDTLYDPAVFTIGNKAYASGWAMTNGYRNSDTHEYDPATDQWTRKNADLSGYSQGASAVAFSLNNKGYMLNWNYQADSIQTSEYDPAVDNWKKVSGFPITKAKYGPINYPHYTRDGKGYVYTGSRGYDDHIADNRIFEFSPISNQWTQVADFGGPVRYLGFAFSIGNKAYIGFGQDSGTDYCDIWEYNP